jgi:hypothetical protein
MEKATKITKKDRYGMMIDILNGAMPAEADKEDLVNFCKAEIAALDKKAAKAKEKAGTKDGAANDKLAQAVRDALTNDFLTIAEIAAKIDGEDITPQKVTYRLNAFVDAGIAESTVTKVGTGNGKRSLKAYRLINAD